MKTRSLLQLSYKGEVVWFTLYKVWSFKEYFIVTQNVAKNGIIQYNKDLFFILYIFCKELAKSVYFLCTRNWFFMKIFMLKKVPT